MASLQTDHGCIHHFDVVRRKVRSRTISQQEGSCWPQARRQGLGSSDWWPRWLHRHRHSCLWRSRTHHRCRNRPWPQGHQRHVILKFVGITCKERSIIKISFSHSATIMLTDLQSKALKKLVCLLLSHNAFLPPCLPALYGWHMQQLKSRYFYNGHRNVCLFLCCSLSLSVIVPPWIMNESHSLHHHPLLCDTKWLYPSNVFLKFMQVFLLIGEVQELIILIYKVLILLSIIGSRDCPVVSNLLNRKTRIVKHILTVIHNTQMYENIDL